MKKFKFNESDCSGTHVYVLFADGEINMTKAGDLLHSRNMHQMQPSVLDYADLPNAILDQFPSSYGKFKCVYLEKEEEAKEYRDYLFSTITDFQLEKMYDYLKKHDYISDDVAARRLVEKREVRDLSISYNSCKGFQATIRDYLKEHLRESSGKRLEYVEECLAGDVVDWPMLDRSREIRDEEVA